MPHQKLKLHNGTDKAIMLIVEPWGEEKEIRPDGDLEVVFTSDCPGEPEVSYGRREIRIFGWEGSTFFLLENNVWDGPTVFELIRRRASIESPKEGERILKDVQAVDELEYIQVQMDNAPYWDANGRDTAAAMAERIEKDLTEVGAAPVGKLVAADIRSSRGIFDESQDNRVRRTTVR